MRTRAFGGPTHTVAVCDIVLVQREDQDNQQPIVFVQDFTPDIEKVPYQELPKGVRTYIDEYNVRRFEDMREFTKWLVDYPAVVDNCWVIK